jgi:hypothetical protein
MTTFASAVTENMVKQIAIRAKTVAFKGDDSDMIIPWF